MKIKNNYLILILTLLLTLSSCEKIEKEEAIEEEVILKATEESNEVKKEKRQIDGGKMRMAIMTPKTLNPLKNEDIYVGAMLNLIFQDLYILNDDRKPEKNLIQTAIPNYADNSLTLTLKNDLIWHDGSVITSDDFIYSLQVLQQADDSVIYKSMIQNIVNYSKVDNMTIIIQYNDAKYLMGYDLLFPIIPKSYYEKVNVTNNIDFEPVGNGYFKFYEQKNSKEIVLERDEDKEDMAYLDTIEVVVLRDRDTEIYAFERSNIDIVVTNMEEWGEYQVVKEPNIYEYTNQVFEFIGFNMDRIIVSDKEFREIIAYHIDKNEILNRLYLGKGLVTNTFVDFNSWLYEKETVSYDRNFNEIQKIIDEKYEYDEVTNTLYKDINGLKKEVSFTILVNEENISRVSLAEHIKNDLINFGIKVEIHKEPYYSYIEKIEMGNFDLVLGGYRFDVDQDVTQFLVNNIFNYKSQELISRIEAFNSVVDEQSYKVSLGELQKLVAEDLPFISLLYAKDTILTDEDLIIPNMPSYSNLFSNVNEWYWVR